MILTLLLACTPPTPTDAPLPDMTTGLLGGHPLNPFPVGALHLDQDGLRLDSEDFGLVGDLTPLPFDRLDFHEGFSPGQTSVVVLDQVNEGALPHWRDPTPGEGGARLLDVDTGTWIPTFAELDAHPQATPGTVLIRPLQALTTGHTIAVVLTTELTPRPTGFQQLLDAPASGLEQVSTDTDGLLATLAGLGLPRDSVAMAWTFPVGDGTAPTRSVWEQAQATSWTLDQVREGTDTVAPNTFRAARGTFTTTEFLIDDVSLAIDGSTGQVTPQGTTEAYLYVHVPESVADAPAGTVPILLFGHGIFATPDLYLNDASDGSSLARLCDEAGYIAVATLWRGLNTPDLGNAIAVSQDFGRMHEISDRLVQAQGNVKALVGLLRDGAIFDDPVFQGANGQKLPGDTLYYYGISLGGIQGAVLQASEPQLDNAVLHVGGSTWSTMLERSSNWTEFELLLETSSDDALDRQRLYALSQLWWDSVDPISYVPELTDRDVLFQVAIGDEQVPNMTSYALVRSMGMPAIEPMVEPVWGVQAQPLPASRGMVQFDPEVALPPDANRPAPVTHAHDIPRNFAGTLQQIQTYLESSQIEHSCGSHPCSSSNPGQ